MVTVSSCGNTHEFTENDQATQIGHSIGLSSVENTANVDISYLSKAIKDIFPDEVDKFLTLDLSLEDLDIEKTDKVLSKTISHPVDQNMAQTKPNSDNIEDDVTQEKNIFEEESKE